jgi:cytochrome c-type biogenesis protein CcmH
MTATSTHSARPERSRGALPNPSLRGVKRRGNPVGLRIRTGLLRFARNDGIGLLSALLLAPLLTTPAYAQSSLPPAAYANSQLEDPAQEAKARALMESLRCLVCQGQSIADSDADMAADMRSLVRQRIAAGESPESIRRWLIDRYGKWVSYDPPLEPVTWPLWGAPLLLLAAGLFLARTRFRRRRT